MRLFFQDVFGRQNFTKSIFDLKLAVIACLISTSALSVCNTDSIPSSRAAFAAQLVQDAKLAQAKDEIELAIADPNEQHLAYTWYVRGFVYKEIYKKADETTNKPAVRDIAVESFMRSKELSQGQEDVLNNDAPLRFLVNTYFNDAVLSASRFDKTNDEACQVLFNRYVALHNDLHLTDDLKSRRADFSKTVAMRYLSLWQSSPSDLDLHKKAVSHFELTVANTDQDCNAGYNLAVAHYKLAEFGLLGQVACDYNEEFDIALAILHKIEKSCPDNLEVLKGLLNIYKHKENDNQRQFYEMKIDEVLKKNNQLKN